MGEHYAASAGRAPSSSIHWPVCISRADAAALTMGHASAGRRPACGLRDSVTILYLHRKNKDMHRDLRGEGW